MSHILFHFDEIKTIQAAASLLKKNGGQVKYMALIKLLYLADREALRLIERPITGDRYVSMKNGPVLSVVKNLITEEAVNRNKWSEYISSPTDYTVKLVNDPGVDELCELEEEILDDVYKQYGKIDQFTLADLTHEICEEWKMPDEKGPGSIPITVEDILMAVGKSEEDIERISKEVKAGNVLKYILPES